MYRWLGKKDSDVSSISLLNQDEQSQNKNLKETFKEIFGTSSDEDLNEQNIIKDVRKSNLGLDTLDALMRVSLNRCEINDVRTQSQEEFLTFD